MNTNVDTRNLRNLADEHRRFLRLIETEQTMLRNAENILSTVRSRFNESYVQSAVNAASASLANARQASNKLASRLNKKHTGLQRALEIYNQAERDATMLSRNSVRDNLKNVARSLAEKNNELSLIQLLSLESLSPEALLRIVALVEHIAQLIREWSQNILSALTGNSPVCALGLDPINFATGNFFYDNEDIFIPGKCPISFVRFYNAIMEYNGTLGSNWTHSYSIRLVRNETDAHIIFEDGHIETYVAQDNGTFDTSAGKGNTLTFDSGNFVYRLILENSKQYLFNEDGFLTSIVDENGNNINLEYHENLLSKVISPSGSLTFYYSESGYISGVSDSTGRTATYSYDADKLIKSTNPNGSTTSYEYDENINLVKIINPLNAEVVSNEFDSAGRVAIQRMPDGNTARLEYDEIRRVTTVTEPNGNKIEYLQDEKYRTVRILHDDCEECFEYDDANNCTKSIDRNVNIWKYIYDNNGNLISSIDPLGNTQSFEYDRFNRLIRTISPLGHTETYAYDEQGTLVMVEDALNQRTVLSHKSDMSAEITQADGTKIRIAYDDRKNITQIVDASESVTKYNYDELNRVVSVTDGNNNKTNFTYDMQGNVTEVRNAEGHVQTYTYTKTDKLKSVTDFNGGRTEREYNEIGKISNFTDQLGRVTRFSYDSMWNVSKVYESNEATTEFVYNAMNRLEVLIKPDSNKIKFEYDANGNTIKTTDEEGNETHFKYDARNKLVEVIGAEDMRFVYTYDTEGKMTRIADALGNTVTIEYDALGRMIRETNAMGESREYTYTPLGQIKTEKDECGRLTCHEYIGGRLLKTVYWDGTTEEFTYDGNGNLIVYKNEESVIQRFEFDSLGRVVQISTDGGGVKRCTYDAMSNVTSVTDELGNVTNYTYTATGKLATATDANGCVTLYAYSEVDQLIEVCQVSGEVVGMDSDFEAVIARNKENQSLRITKYKRNIMGQVEQVEDALGNRETYKYSAKGHLIEKIDRDGFITKYGYSAHGDTTNIHYADGRTVLMSYNALRQLTEIQDWLGITKIETDALGRTTKIANHNNDILEYTWGKLGERRSITYPDGKIVNYDYDDALRLTKIHNGDQTIKYSYNSDLELAEKQFGGGVKTQYRYNDLGQISEINHFGANGLLDSYRYAYNDAGHKTSIEKMRNGVPEDSGFFKYSYDKLNRISSIKKDNALLRSYEYDIFGNRTSIASGDSRTNCMYNALNQLVASSDKKSYAYDRRGNLTHIYNDEKLINQYSYGAINRLEQAENHENNLSAIYKYTGLGNRVGHSTGVIGKDPTMHVHDIFDPTSPYDNLITRRTPDSTQNFIWDTVLLSSSDERGLKNYMVDDLGSPIRFGEDALAYDEFGVPLTPVASAVFGFTGYANDSVANTLFAQSREYMPTTGRFISQDTHWHIGNMIYGDIERYEPWEVHNGGPDSFAIRQSSNLYVYALNNPKNYLDRSGRCVSLIITGIGGLVGVGTQLVSDIGTSIINRELSFSSWETYAGAFVGGAAAGFLVSPAGIVLSGGSSLSPSVIAGISGGLSTATTQGLEYATGRNRDRSFGEIVFNSLVSAGTSALLAGILDRIPKPRINIGGRGVFHGRGSYSASFRRVMSRIANGNAANIGWSTIRNAAVYFFVSDANKSVLGWFFKDAIESGSSSLYDFLVNLFSRQEYAFDSNK